MKSIRTYLILRLLVVALPGLLLSCSKKTPDPIVPLVVAPVLTGVTIADITPNSAKASATISAVGLGTATTATISEYGLCYSSNVNPTTTDTKVQVGTTTAKPVDIVASLTGLQPNTTYYVRAYATSGAGTGYGDVKTFKTKDGSIPTVETRLVPSRSFTTATLEGRVLVAGAPIIIRYGHVWSSTNQNPTTNDSKNELTLAGAQSGFISDIRNLSLNTTYYYRAYATNEVGTG